MIIRNSNGHVALATRFSCRTKLIQFAEVPALDRTKHGEKSKDILCFNFLDTQVWENAAQESNNAGAISYTQVITCPVRILHTLRRTQVSAYTHRFKKVSYLQQK